MTENDLELPTDVVWRPLPSFGSSLVIGTSFESPGCDAVRLKEVLGQTAEPECRTDMSDRVIVMHGSDRNLLLLGWREGRIGAAIRRGGARAVIGPGFSTWWEWSPFDSLVAVARSAWFAAEIVRHLPAIPTVVWRNDEDLNRWAAWILETGPEAIAVDLGTARPPDRWSWALRGIAHLERQIGSRTRLRLIVNGPSTIDRLVGVRDVWSSDLTFASQHPWHLARGGKRLLENLEAASDDVDRAELEKLNRQTFEGATARITGLARSESEQRPKSVTGLCGGRPLAS